METSAIDSNTSRQRWWIEVSVVLAIAWLVPMLGALISYAEGLSWATDPGSEWASGDFMQPSRLDLAHQTAASIQILAPVLFIMWLHRRWSDFGVGRFKLLRDSGVSALIVVADLLAFWIFANALFVFANELGVAGYWMDAGASVFAESTTDSVDGAMTASYAMPWLSMLVMLTANSLSEEFVFRGVLLERFTRLMGPHSAVWLSSFLFASYHMYQGLYGVISALSLGVLAAYSMRLTKSIWPCVLAHTIANLIAYSMA